MFDQRQSLTHMTLEQQQALEMSRRERVARLDRTIGDLAAQIHAATAELLDAAAEFDDLEGWGDWGTRSMPHYFSWRTGMSMAAARRATAVAARLKDMPATRDAMAQGKMSSDKAHSIARVATADNEATLVGWAEDLPVYELDRLCRTYAKVVDEATGVANERHARRYLRYGYDDERCFYLRGRLTAEAGAVVEAALDKTRAELRAGPAEIDVHDHLENTYADALVAIAHQALIEDDLGGASDAYQIAVHVDIDTLTSDAPGRADINGRVGIAPETARRCACDAPFISVVESDGRPLSVGRKTRSIPRSVDRALRARDKTCRFPNCSSVRYIDRHHVMFWGRGGETSLDNLVRLCHWHHRLVHEGGYKMDFDGTTARFFTPGGTEILPSPPLSPPEQDLSERYAGADPHIDHRCLPPVAENEMNHDLAVSCLVQADNLGGPAP
jgi:hypothetical protein